VQVGQPVTVKLDEMPYRTFHTEIGEIGPEIKVSPRHISSKGGGELMSKQDESGMERPLNTTFQALAAIDDPDGRLMQGLRGTAKNLGQLASPRPARLALPDPHLQLQALTPSSDSSARSVRL